MKANQRLQESVSFGFLYDGPSEGKCAWTQKGSLCDALTMNQTSPSVAAPVTAEKQRNLPPGPGEGASQQMGRAIAFYMQAEDMGQEHICSLLERGTFVPNERLPLACHEGSFDEFETNENRRIVASPQHFSNACSRILHRHD